MRAAAGTHEVMDLVADAVRVVLEAPEERGHLVASECFARLTPEQVLGFDAFLVRMDDQLAWTAGTPESRFGHRVCRMAYLERCRRAGAPPEPDRI